MKRILTMAALMLPAIAIAGEFWGTVNLASLHTKPEQKLNHVNYGVGIEYQHSEEVLYLAGAYRNSYYRTSAYTLAGWTPASIGPLRIGVLAGFITGYPALNGGGVTPGIAGIARIEGGDFGANLILIPPSLKISPWTLGLQFKFTL